MHTITFNRRAIMLSAVAGASSILLPNLNGSALANTQTQPGLSGNAGYFRFKVGDINATVLSDGVIGGPPRIYASDAPNGWITTTISARTKEKCAAEERRTRQ